MQKAIPLFFSIAFINCIFANIALPARTYKISVTIPAAISNKVKDSPQTIQTQQIIRNKQPVIVKSIVAQ